MPKDIIDVIDTAVKIGLGALISRVTTYFVANKNHFNDKAKVLIKKKVSILEYSTENIEPYFHALNRYLSRIDGVLRAGKVQGGSAIDKALLINIKKVDGDLLEARKERSIAVSRLKLIGANDVTKHLSVINLIVNELRSLAIFEKTLPNNEQLKDFKDRFENEKNKFYKSLECEFLAIHS
ncbi:hypothetical protein A8139_10765 [Marinomonas primoryensis]|uniref:Uncharacterized protein n=1 Tax=Marinomonas primoryensis TaxID=178399 RepID=A0A2Z4PSG5_9GAMM|nr:hypothetical protein [Marinomonas primoryensis]AWY00427.1 hypothetical protein A8139_10765 [Marinomonas primoryensis]